MEKVERNDACPCGSGQKFKKCCGPALAGDRWPETPEALMRSRYSAYVIGNVAHLYRTTHPDNDAVKEIDREQFERETLAYCRHVDYKGLTIHETQPPDAEGVAVVVFTADYKLGVQHSSLTERSEFVKLADRWVYLKGAAPDGTQL
jgi:SEC-C motif-containing protein